MITAIIARLFCSLAAAFPDIASDSRCVDTPPHSTAALRTFTYVPSIAPALAIPKNTPLQFNGSYPGQGDVPGQLGWWSREASGNAPVDLISFVQYNADSGVVFWAERTRFEMYLSAVTEKTYAVKLGQPESETPAGLAGNWTISKIPKTPHDTEQKYGYGWEGDYKSWFACEGKGNDAGFYGLYFGGKLDGCGDHFVLGVNYEQPSQ
ncbi:hypothetical protein BGX38DRAFT_1268714 [Terfezia claveryi]|nr:hypothetical protein BGX38DRAFT_1268714 [Terfezia claveryi]